LGDRNKGYHLLQAALDRLASQGLAGRLLLLVIGIDAPKEPPRSAIPIRFTGRLDDESDLALHLSAANALALPSLQENQPNLVIEAMACGRAAVAFGATGLPELVAHRETGYLATPHESEDLAAGIAWLAEAPDRADELGRRARTRAERDYGIDRMAGRYVELYRSLAPGPSKRAGAAGSGVKRSEADPRASW
jgi:glycosyltransferase involved in cell wall biosynthesis